MDSILDSIIVLATFCLDVAESKLLIKCCLSLSLKDSKSCFIMSKLVVWEWGLCLDLVLFDLIIETFDLVELRSLALMFLVFDCVGLTKSLILSSSNAFADLLFAFALLL